jgi:chromosome segregation ATPase
LRSPALTPPFSQTSASIGRADASIEELTLTLTELSNTKHHLAGQVKSLQNEVEHVLPAKLTHAQEKVKVKQLNDSLVTAKNDASSKASKLASASKELASSNRELASVQEQLASAQAELASTKAQVESLGASNADKTSQLHTISSSIGTLESQFQQVRPLPPPPPPPAPPPN